MFVSFRLFSLSQETKSLSTRASSGPNTSARLQLGNTDRLGSGTVIGVYSYEIGVQFQTVLVAAFPARGFQVAEDAASKHGHRRAITSMSDSQYGPSKRMC